MVGMEAARHAQLAEHDEASENPPPAPQPDAPDLPAGFVVQGRGTGYFVQSRSAVGVWWLVSGRSCSCPAGRAGRPSCWHRAQVAAFCARIAEANKRPSAPPNISALVD